MTMFLSLNVDSHRRQASKQMPFHVIKVMLKANDKWQWKCHMLHSIAGCTAQLVAVWDPPIEDAEHTARAARLGI